MIALDLNRRLATLLGWANITETGGALLGTPPDGEPQCRGQARVPDWAGDWRDCGPLMVAHLYEIKFARGWTTARGLCQLDVARRADPAQTPDQTARQTIVAAVIAKLEADQ